MKLICYPLLSTRSRRAIVRTKKKWGHPYYYNPRSDLIHRLMGELGMTYEQVYNQLQAERRWLLSHGQYYT